MRFNPNPVFRKAIVPWYDSETVCIAVIVFMFIVLLFGCAGIFVAREQLAYHKYTWAPLLLVILSGGVIVSTAIRLIRRYYQLSK